MLAPVSKQHFDDERGRPRGASVLAQLGLDLAAVDRSARPGRVRRVHRVVRGFRCRVGFANSGSLLFVDESAEEIATA